MRAPKRQTVDRRVPVAGPATAGHHIGPAEASVAPSTPTLADAMADAVADALGERLALEYIARTTGAEAS